MIYEVKIECPFGLPFPQIDPMREWCNNTLEHPYTVRHHVDNYDNSILLSYRSWKFTTEEDAALFALTWL